MGRVLTHRDPHPASRNSASEEPPRAGRHRLVLGAYVATIFLGSALMFLVEPMFAKMMLPLLGGTPSVWNTAMLFFQTVLLAGYAYSHWSSRRPTSRRRLALHAALIVLPVAVLPIAVPDGWTPPTGGNPVLWVLALLVVALGLPFFVVATSGPLLQKWFSRTVHPSGGDPYFLYRASNLGSMLALLGYPILLEPRFRLADQAEIWTAGYLLFGALTITCAAILVRHPGTAEPDERLPDPVPDAGEAPGPTPIRRLRWVALAFVPSSFMLAATTHLTTDIAAIPLLWVIPLALYLWTFVLAFGPRHGTILRIAVRVQPFLLLPLLLCVVLGATKLPVLLVPLTLAGFFVTALVCHGRLAADRPSPRHLTGYYVWLAVGGMLGGVFNTLIAPLVFNSIAEFPLAIVLACLLRPPAGFPRRAWSRRLDVLLPVGLAIAIPALAWLARSGGLPELAAVGLAVAVAAIACFAFAERPVRFGLGMAAIGLIGGLVAQAPVDVLYAQRTFFGVQRVTSEDGFHKLVHGNTIHGAQSTDPALRREPLTYYHRGGPVGDVFADLSAARSGRIGVIGLGTGSLACYARPGQEWTFFEIDPAIEQIARDPKLFSYLSDCLERYDVVLGDGRLSMQRMPAEAFGLIAVDAFNSDAIPVHLLTREALQLYVSKLAPGGAIAVHISNRYLDLEPVLGKLARDAGLSALIRSQTQVSAEETALSKSPSQWVVLSRRPADLEALAGKEGWGPPEVSPDDVWTDEYSNLLSVFGKK